MNHWSSSMNSARWPSSSSEYKTWSLLYASPRACVRASVNVPIGILLQFTFKHWNVFRHLKWSEEKNSFTELFYTTLAHTSPNTTAAKWVLSQRYNRKVVMKTTLLHFRFIHSSVVVALSSFFFVSAKEKCTHTYRRSISKIIFFGAVKNNLLGTIMTWFRTLIHTAQNANQQRKKMESEI